MLEAMERGYSAQGSGERVWRGGRGVAEGKTPEAIRRELLPTRPFGAKCTITPLFVHLRHIEPRAMTCHAEKKVFDAHVLDTCIVWEASVGRYQEPQHSHLLGEQAQDDDCGRNAGTLRQVADIGSQVGPGNLPLPGAAPGRAAVPEPRDDNDSRYRAEEHQDHEGVIHPVIVRGSALI